MSLKKISPDVMAVARAYATSREVNRQVRRRINQELAGRIVAIIEPWQNYQRIAKEPVTAKVKSIFTDRGRVMVRCHLQLENGEFRTWSIKVPIDSLISIMPEEKL